jgi:hypothetical protein
MGEIDSEGKDVQLSQLPVADRVLGIPGSNVLSDAERERRSVQAKRLVKEGKLGGTRRGSGRPSKLRTKLAVDLSNQIATMSETRLSLAIAVCAIVETMGEDEAKLILDAVLRRGS